MQEVPASGTDALPCALQRLRFACPPKPPMPESSYSYLLIPPGFLVVCPPPATRLAMDLCLETTFDREQSTRLSLGFTHRRSLRAWGYFRPCQTHRNRQATPAPSPKRDANTYALDQLSSWFRLRMCSSFCCGRRVSHSLRSVPWGRGQGHREAGRGGVIHKGHPRPVGL